MTLLCIYKHQYVQALVLVNICSVSLFSARWQFYMQIELDTCLFSITVLIKRLSLHLSFFFTCLSLYLSICKSHSLLIWNHKNHKMVWTKAKVSLALSLVTVFLGISVADLKVGFYSDTCPQAESIVKRVVSGASLSDPNLPAILLRLHFHDCFVEVQSNFSLTVCALLCRCLSSEVLTHAFRDATGPS